MVRAVIVGIFSLLAACSGPALGSGSPPPTMVRVAEAKLEPSRESTAYLAEVRARKSVEMHPRVDGYVRAIRVKPGDVVLAGAVLLEIDAMQEQAELATLEAARSTASAEVGIAQAQLHAQQQDLARAKADRGLAQKQYERLSRLLPQGAVTIDEVDEAERNLEVARAAVGSAARALDAQRATITTSRRSVAQSSNTVGQQKAALDYYTIRAPFDGIVGDIPVRVGELVGPTVTLTTLDRRDEIDVLIRVPADRGPQLRAGLPVELVDREGEVLHETHLVFVSPRADESTQTILVEAPIGVGDRLRTGQIVRARIVWEQRQSPRVPLTAVRRLSGKAFVFVVEDDPSLGTVARQRMVELGPLDAQSYPVDEGIEEGDRVIVAGVQKLRDGAPVSLEEASS